MAINLPFMASFSLVTVTVCVLIYWLWWTLPKRLTRGQANVQTSRRLESLYRKNVSQALAGISILAGILITIEQTIATQRDSLNAQRSATRASIIQQQQKALELFAVPNQASHVGAVYALQAVGYEMPTLQKSILFELAAAAVVFSPRTAISAHSYQSADNRRTVSADAQAALSVIGNNQLEMTSGLPLPLARGFFRGVSLPNAYLNGVNLRETDLSGSDLYQAKLYGANLRFVRLSGANLAGAELFNAALVGAVLCEDLNVAVSALQTGKPITVQVAGIKLDKADLSGAWLVGVDFGGEHSKDLTNRATLSEVNFSGAHLNGVKFGNALLDRARFQGADLTEADFSEASIADIKTDDHTIFCRTKWPDRIRSEGCPIGRGKFEGCPELPLITPSR